MNFLPLVTISFSILLALVMLMIAWLRRPTSLSPQEIQRIQATLGVSFENRQGGPKSFLNSLASNSVLQAVGTFASPDEPPPPHPEDPTSPHVGRFVVNPPPSPDASSPHVGRFVVGPPPVSPGAAETWRRVEALAAAPQATPSDAKNATWMRTTSLVADQDGL